MLNRFCSAEFISSEKYEAELILSEKEVVNILKQYHKPEISRVEMRPMEAALSGCKSTLQLQDAACLAGGVTCIYPGTIACNVIGGS